jgi:hypothetical protein
VTALDVVEGAGTPGFAGATEGTGVAEVTGALGIVGVGTPGFAGATGLGVAEVTGALVSRK